MELIEIFVKLTIVATLTLVTVVIVKNLVQTIQGKGLTPKGILALCFPLFIFVMIVLANKLLGERIFHFFNYWEMFLAASSLFNSFLWLRFIQINKDSPFLVLLIFYHALSSVGFFHLQNLLLFRDMHIGESRGYELLYASVWGAALTFFGFIAIYLIRRAYWKRE